ncbi:regulator of chromosome condensation (RCC1) repeat-containing protein [Actinophytocola oryzae]|uniref:Regulator of chromosome condensation (RCC1) repeat-containing protein n=1 Tax=Actinophytocola oryzae TaxID=502181 RepID=A0A4R7UUM8_9PSEU|nr:regulator of chromosome condensation (RCC1) repeat-containing protein [Actinophytocola oryzae]
MRVSGLTGVVAAAGGGITAFAVKRDGTVWSWGSNWLGALGNGSDCECASNVPGQVVDIGGAVDVGSHGYGGLVLDNAGRVWGWGSNQNGELGTQPSGSRPRPGLIPGLAGVTALGDGGQALVPRP